MISQLISPLHPHQAPNIHYHLQEHVGGEGVST